MAGDRLSFAENRQRLRSRRLRFLHGSGSCEDAAVRRHQEVADRRKDSVAELKRQESPLKSKLMEHIKLHMKDFVAMRHEDIRTSGIPDLSLTGYGKTTWWEVKHGTPNFDSRGIQELTMLRLAGAGYARYLIYIEDADGNNKRTLIVHPKHIGDMEAEAWCIGHNHRWVIEFFRKVHKP